MTANELDEALSLQQELDRPLGEVPVSASKVWATALALATASGPGHRPPLVAHADELKVGARSPHVLLLLQNELYARTLERFLALRGWQTTRARRARDALNLWRSSGADVALVDLGLSSLALLTAAQTLTPPGRAVVVTRVLAATQLPEVVKRRLGIEAIAVRPCRIDEVAAVLSRALPPY